MEFPRTFGRYQLTGLLGSGGMGEVFRAESLPVAGITRVVAIKRLLAGDDAPPEVGQAFLDEARIWVELKHPNIVQVVDFGYADKALFLALELVDGTSAASLLTRGGPLPLREALCISERIARALAHAHTAMRGGKRLDIVHRDVKPANVLISREGLIKLTDFGIARAGNRAASTQTGFVKGSFGYFSPEQAQGLRIDGRSDVFSLGCTLFALLTGAPPVEGDDAKALLRLTQGKLKVLPPSFDGNVRKLLSSLLEMDPAARPDAESAANRIRALITPAAPEDIERELGARVSRLAGPPTPDPTPSRKPTSLEPPPAPPTVVVAPPSVSTPPGTPAPRIARTDPLDTPPPSPRRRGLAVLAVAVLSTIVTAVLVPPDTWQDLFGWQDVPTATPKTTPVAGVGAIETTATLVTPAPVESAAPVETPTPTPETVPSPTEIAVATPASTPTRVAVVSSTPVAKASPRGTPSLARAMELIATGKRSNINLAVADLERLLLEPTTPPAAWFFLAGAYYAQGKTDLACIGFKRYLRLEPDGAYSAEARNSLASFCPEE